MKSFLLIPLAFLAACASHAPKKITVAPAVPAGRPVRSTGLRIADQLSEYRLGRYLDARDPLVMHEGHPVYRIDNTARWDLRPQNGAALDQRDAVARPTLAASDAVVAEVNKQRAATREFTEEMATLNQRLSQLGKAVEQTEEIARQNVALKRDLAALGERLDALDAPARDRKSIPPQRPSPSPDKW